MPTVLWEITCETSRWPGRTGGGAGHSISVELIDNLKKFITVNFSVLLVPRPSVADPGCLLQIPDPETRFLSIPDPGSRNQQQQQTERGNKIFVLPFVSHKFHKVTKLETSLLWTGTLQKIILANWQRIAIRPSKIWVAYPGSGIRKKTIPDPGVKNVPDSESVSATLPRPFDDVDTKPDARIHMSEY